MSMSITDAVIFCTAYIESDPQRYIDWIDYYTDYFSGLPVSLWMFNDGPHHNRIDFKGINVYEFERRLGRQSVWIFPGWKRSFYTAVKLFSSCKILAHIESDCWLTPAAKEEFVYYLRQDGYFTGFTKTYNFPEGALQIINKLGVRQYITDKYSCEENWYENIDFEQDLKRLQPTYILEGDRVEKDLSRFKDNFTFVSSVTYQDYLNLYAKPL